MDSQSIKSHVIDPKTHELLFVSASLKAERPNARVGSLCYETVMGLDAPCPFCRLDEISQEDVYKRQSLNFVYEYIIGRIVSTVKR